MSNQLIIARFREYAHEIKEQLGRCGHASWQEWSRWEMTGAYCMAVKMVSGSSSEAERALEELKAIKDGAKGKVAA